MAETDLVKCDSASDPLPCIERLNPVEGALLRLDVRLDEFADNVCAAMDDMKRSVIRTIVIMAGLQTAILLALLYVL